MRLLARTLARTLETASGWALRATRAQQVRQRLTDSLIWELADDWSSISVWVATRLIASTGDMDLPRIAELAPDRSMLLFCRRRDAGERQCVCSGTGDRLTAGCGDRTPRWPGATHHPSYHLAARSLNCAGANPRVCRGAHRGLLSNSYLRVMHVDPRFEESRLPALEYPGSCRGTVGPPPFSASPCSSLRRSCRPLPQLSAPSCWYRSGPSNRLFPSPSSAVRPPVVTSSR